MGQVENDMILGTSAYKNGMRATTFRPEIDAGLGYLNGATPAPKVRRTYYLERHGRRAVVGARQGRAGARRDADRGSSSARTPPSPPVSR